MGELKDLYQRKLDAGISARQMAIDTGINYNNLYTFCKSQYGKQLPTKATYAKLKEYFGEDIMVNGEPIIYPVNADRAIRFQDKEESLKFKQVMDILEFNERTIIPNCFINHEERLINLLSMIGINAKYWFVDHNGYLEKISEKGPVDELWGFVEEVNKNTAQRYKQDNAHFTKFEPVDAISLEEFEEVRGIFNSSEIIKPLVSDGIKFKTDFKPGDIEELAKDERFKPIFLKTDEVVEELAKVEMFNPKTNPVEDNFNDALNQAVNYLIGLVKDKMWKEFEEKQKEIHKLAELEPLEALKIIREKQLL